MGPFIPTKPQSTSDDLMALVDAIAEGRYDGNARLHMGRSNMDGIRCVTCDWTSTATGYQAAMEQWRIHRAEAALNDRAL